MAPIERLTADLPIGLQADLSVDAGATMQLAGHVRRGGIASLLFAGNGNLQSMSLGQFAVVLDVAADCAADGPVTIGMGPELGRMLDQAPLIERCGLKSVLVLPILGPSDTHGTADGIRYIAQRLGHGVTVDLVRDNHLRPVTLAKLRDEGAVVAVRYCIPAVNPGDDGYLDRVVEIMGAGCVVSGMGEPAALDHLHVRGLGGMTSGAAALAPARVRAMVSALDADRVDDARRLLAPLLELERVRAMLGPVQVLHDAVSHAGIAAMGPQMPMVSPVKAKYRAAMEAAVRALMVADRQP